jgi:hypothetical protein
LQIVVVPFKERGMAAARTRCWKETRYVPGDLWGRFWLHGKDMLLTHNLHFIDRNIFVETGQERGWTT